MAVCGGRQLFDGVWPNYPTGLNNGRSWKNSEALNNEICSCNSQACWHLRLFLKVTHLPPVKARLLIISVLSKLIHHLLVIIKPRPNHNCPSYLLPAVPSRGKQKTGICRRTTSPRWEQTIVWEDLSMEEVKYNCSLYYSRMPDVWHLWKYEDDHDVSRWWRGVWSWRSGTTTGSARPRISSVAPGLYFSRLILWICEGHFHGFVKVNFSTRSGSTLVPAATSVARLPGWTGRGRRSRCGSRCWTDPTSGWRDASDSGQAWTLGLNSDLDPQVPTSVTSNSSSALSPD